MKFTRARFCGLSILALAIACGALFAQSVQKPFTVPGTNGSWSVTGYVLTTSSVVLCGSNLTSSGSLNVALPPCNATVFMCGSDENASSGTAVTTTIQDATGGFFWNAIAPLSPTAASSYNIPLGSAASTPIGCRPFPSGVAVKASTGSTITFSAWGVY